MGPAVMTEADRAVRSPVGGFTLHRKGEALRVRPRAAGWSVEGLADSIWELERPGSTQAGFVLRAADGRESARSSPPVGTDRSSGLRFVLLEDGRLFRIVRRPPGDDGFDLLGWEVPGAYVRARRREGSWELSLTPSGRELPDADTAMLLLAAEALDAEEPL